MKKRLDQIKKNDVIEFEDGDKAKVLARFDCIGNKYVYVNKILPDESDVTDIYRIMKIHLEDYTLENVTDPEELIKVAPLAKAYVDVPDRKKTVNEDMLIHNKQSISDTTNAIIAEYDGKKYTIDNYLNMVEDAISEKKDALTKLFEHGSKLRELGYEHAPYGLEDWLFFIARNGKTEWAIDKLYMRRKINSDEEAAIWALEAGVDILEEKGYYAPQSWYLLINDYYYKKVYSASEEDLIEKQYLMNTVGTWYKKGVKAGCDPEVLEGRTWAENPVNFSGGKNENGGCSGCYIATAVYGSYDCAEVWTLRRFRDDYLSKRMWGRYFIKIYYRISPKLVDVFGGSKVFNKIFKKPLDKMVERLNRKGIENTYYEDH